MMSFRLNFKLQWILLKITERIAKTLDICFRWNQKISKTKGNSFEQKIPPRHTYARYVKKQRQFLWTKTPPPPGIRTPDLSKNKGNSFEQKIPPGIRTPDLSTFTANLSKKIHAKNLKIFLKNFFLKKTCFWGTKKGFFFGGGGGNSQEKMFTSQKKASNIWRQFGILKNIHYCERLSLNPNHFSVSPTFFLSSSYFLDHVWRSFPIYNSKNVESC